MFKNVLLAIDLAHKDEQNEAIEAAKKYAGEGSHIFVVSVIPPLEGGGFIQSFLPADYDANLIKKAKEALHYFTKERMPEIKDIKHLVVHGKVYEKITDIAEQLDIDLIITMASIKRDHQSSGFGPNVARIVRNSDCSVLILR
ncbi:MAG: universal stress protein UspA [Gammaproteobacteria bacterium]|nr:MAG: universal stress protein UspA [Gammaproteobacteria bacterium]